MRRWILAGTLLLAFQANAQTLPSKLWAELETKRQMLSGLHQEFETTQTVKTERGTQESRHDVVLDFAQKQWRESLISGAGNRTFIFDGQDLFVTEPDQDEYLRIKRKANSDDPEPAPYRFPELDWPKAKIDRRPCGFSGSDHPCIIIDVPIKNWSRLGANSYITRMSDGHTEIAVDSETGMLVESLTRETIDYDRAVGAGNEGGYELITKYALKSMSYGSPVDAALFKLPGGVHEVKEFTKWNSARIKKELAGKAAPDLQVMDIQGNLISLSSLRGKTVLLDFWATWCPPCVHDAPALDKLFRTYGGKNLMIIGISVNEEREVVEKFLQKHPHDFPVVLTTENEMPRPYEIGIFPTYIVIAPDGTLTAAMEGDQGFGELRQVIEKAGMEVN